VRRSSHNPFRKEVSLRRVDKLNRNILQSVTVRRFSPCPAACFPVLFLVGYADAAQVPGEDNPAPPSVSATERPLWEVGIGVVAGAISDYPGSDRYQVRGLPLPYFIYRGDFLRSDESGTRLRASIGIVEWEISGGGSLSSNSQSGARAGMPKLDYLLEAGPKAKITIARPTDNSRLLIDLPVRAAASTNFSSRFQTRGATFSPDVTLENRSVFGSPWNGRISVGVEFATQGLQEFYYGVAPQFAEPGRPAYEAHGGYLSSSISLTAFRRLRKNFNFFIALDFDDYQGAASRASPLFRSSTGFGAAVGFAWSLQ
jgi:outer membrane protein